jgi:hypothetical protein
VSFYTIQEAAEPVGGIATIFTTIRMVTILLAQAQLHHPGAVDRHP